MSSPNGTPTGTPSLEELRDLFARGERVSRISEGRHVISEDELLASGLNVAEQAEIRNLRVAYAREVECWRWLSEHVSGLLEDSARLDWLLSSASLDVTPTTVPRVDHGICTMMGLAAARADVDHLREHGVVADEDVLRAARTKRRALCATPAEERER